MKQFVSFVLCLTLIASSVIDAVAAVASGAIVHDVAARASAVVSVPIAAFEAGPSVAPGGLGAAIQQVPNLVEPAGTQNALSEIAPARAASAPAASAEVLPSFRGAATAVRDSSPRPAEGTGGFLIEAAGGVEIFDGTRPRNVAVDWAKLSPVFARAPGIGRFPSFYSSFLRRLDEDFSSRYDSRRELFLRDVEQNLFFDADPEIGQLETKLISGQVAVRFVPAGTTPMTMVWVNVPLAVNANQPMVPLRGNSHLEHYKSRLLVNRQVRLSNVFKGSFGAPHRAVLLIDQADGSVTGSSFSPALRFGSPRWFQHWSKATLEMFKYGDLVRGVVSAPIQAGLAVLLALLSQRLHPQVDPVLFGPAIAAGLFALILATFSDSYAAFVQRGDNMAWESAKRLLIGALLAYPISIMQAHGDWSVVLTLKTTALVWLVGFGDRYLSTVMNVVPKIHQKYYMKPWFFPVRTAAPFRDLAARLAGDAGVRGATIKGVTLTREALAILRFSVKFTGLFLDPVLMAFTYGLPVATILLYLCGIPFEIYNYRAVKRLADGNPLIRKEFEQLKDQHKFWLKLPRLLEFGRWARAKKLS